ncbi:peptidoglycan/xylan/chitin deacetylase (PgdA/CDA1 family) [Sedimentibacter acidaminivorans]|uniref:Peptidoglycan/xylan/chitin deacetylase (PgdA/CDA1 family) n=1 Tax=Sedimentibacter acidaminivorans TaxID=913099 RepID=A0ABS4GHW0_9FIRM|nr:polysaccharide deacetylase family protein [Sedimentibacter acidaminivorans]MBP1927275.1 peptidoglycan/xylan/chitin deacetylase (PgdA/CDA1 family) [Sedimentibacter acidaminivorans]
MKKKILIYSIMIMLIFIMNSLVFAFDREIDPDQPMVAITFDDGPSQYYTPIILDVLKENDARATFFVLGNEVKKNKEILVRMIDEGNEIGNHSYNHKDLTSISDYELYQQIVGTDEFIEDITGIKPTVIRPPYGFVNDRISSRIYKPIILWSLDTLDWQNRNTKKICSNILENVKDGDIVLMHDIYGTTADAVKIVVPELVKRGYQLVTVSELNQYRQATMLPGHKYSNMYK